MYCLEVYFCGVAQFLQYLAGELRSSLRSLCQGSKDPLQRDALQLCQEPED